MVAAASALAEGCFLGVLVAPLGLDCGFSRLRNLQSFCVDSVQPFSADNLSHFPIAASRLAMCAKSLGSIFPIQCAADATLVAEAGAVVVSDESVTLLLRREDSLTF